MRHQITSEPAGVLDQDNTNAVALYAVEQRAEAGTRLDWISTTLAVLNCLSVGRPERVAHERQHLAGMAIAGLRQRLLDACAAQRKWDPYVGDGSSASFQAQVAHFRLYSETRHGRPRRKATDEAWRIATNIAKLPELLIKRRPDLVDRVPRR